MSTDGERPVCTCLPEPDGINDVCPVHGHEAPCGHCGHLRRQHVEPFVINDREECKRCSCAEWFAAGEEPER